MGCDRSGGSPELMDGQEQYTLLKEADCGYPGALHALRGLHRRQYLSLHTGVFRLYRVAFFWGIGPVIHGLNTYAGNWLSGKEWEEGKIREIMEREDRMLARPVR